MHLNWHAWCIYDTSRVSRTSSPWCAVSDRVPSRASTATGVTEWAPAIDVNTKNENIVIRAELPGVKPEILDITIQDNVLTISDERKAEQEGERGGYHIRERRYGSFSRSLDATLRYGREQDQRLL